MNYTKYTLLALVLMSAFACTKDHSEPTVSTVPTGTVKTIAEVRALYQPGEEFFIQDDISVYGTVTADETNGNLYKESYIQDASGALYLRFQSNSGLYIGDSVRVYLKGAKMLKYNQMLQIDSVHADNAIEKISTQKNWEPEVVEINDVLNNIESFQAKLIQFNNVRFTEANQGVTYADGDNQVTGSRVLQNLNGDQIEVRTSGYANFANDTLPGGVGTFIGVVSQYNTGAQLLIRTPNELNMTGEPPVVKDFEDGSITSGGWTTQVATGIYDWVVDEPFPGNKFAKISNYNGVNTASEAWLISPANDFSNSTNASISISSDYKYDGPTLEVLVSTDYDGTSTPSTATWSTLNVPLDTDGANWGLIGSGEVSLSSYHGNDNVYIAFKYTGSNSDGSTWEVDNILINK